MAGTITLQTGITHVNGSLSINVPQESKAIVQTTQGAFTDTQSIATTDTALTIGSIATLGVMVVKNLDATNFVDIGSYVGGTFYPLVRVLARERYPFRVKPGLTLYAKADTAAVKIQKTIYEA